jgi:branched-chain amino acid transport system substrate-binding protein
MSMKKNRLMKIASVVGLSLSLILIPGVRHAGAAEPIKIGAVMSVTGFAGNFGTNSKLAITYLSEELNQKGGIAGRPVQVLFEDDQSVPTNSLVAATKLIRDKNVSMLLGPTLTPMVMPTLPLVEKEKVPQLAIGAGHEVTVPLKKWVFRIPVTDYRLAPRMLDFVVNTLGARKIAVLYSLDSSGKMGAQGIDDNIDKYGASVIIKETFEATDTNMIPQLTKIKAAQPDVIILWTSVAPAAVVAKNYGQLGMKTTVVTSHGVFPTQAFMAAAESVLDKGTWIIFGTRDIYADKLPPSDPWRTNIFDPFNKALKEKYGKDWEASYANGFDAFNIAAQALKIAGTDDRAAIRDALEKVRYEGMMGTYKYSPTDHDGNSGEAFWGIYRKDGTWWPYKK